MDLQKILLFTIQAVVPVHRKVVANSMFCNNRSRPLDTPSSPPSVDFHIPLQNDYQNCGRINHNSVLSTVTAFHLFGGTYA